MRSINLLGVLGTSALCSVALAGERFPGRTWMQYVTPEEAGFSSNRLQQAKEYWASTESVAAMIVYDGAVVAAWGDVERRFLLHSVRKSLMSALYGIHVDAGNIDLQKTMAQPGIDDVNPRLNTQEKQAKIIHLLKARSGVYHAAAAESANAVKPQRGEFKPGTHWCYNNWDFNTLCTILEQETGVKVFEEFEKRFADPLGMQDYRARDGQYRKALAWLGHSSSDMLDLYYHLHDEDSQQTMQALAESAHGSPNQPNLNSPFEGNLRATGQSKIEKLSQVPEFQELAECLVEGTERAGFEPARQA